MTAYRETMGQVLQRMYDNKQLQIQERELSDTELKRREEIAKELPDEEFKDRYGSRWKEVKLATATKQAKSESVEEEKLERMDEAAGFSAGMISKLKKSYSTLTKVDPTSPTAKKLFGVLDKMNKEQLIQIVKADINFLSLLAANRLIKDHNMKGAEINKLKKEEVDLDERARQLKDPKKEMMVSKGGDVKVIDKKDWPKYEKKGYVQAEETEIKEGTWAFPSNSRDIKKAKDFMRKPQPLGKEGDDASSALYSIFGDDELHDELYKAGKENPKRDARDIVKQWLKDMVGKDYRDPKDAKNVKDVAKQLGIKEEVELDESEFSAMAYGKKDQRFVVKPRDTRGMAGKQDKFKMYVVQLDNRGNEKKIIKDLGSHVSIASAQKFAKNRGIIEEVELNERPSPMMAKGNYYTVGGDRYDGGVVFTVYVKGKKVHSQILDGTQDYEFKGKKYKDVNKAMDAIAKAHRLKSSDFAKVNEQFDDSWDYSTDQKGMEDSSGVYNDTEGPTFQADYLSDVEPKIGGSQRAALEELVNMYSFAEILDTIEDIYAKNNELAAADYAGEFAAKFRKWMDRD